MDGLYDYDILLLAFSEVIHMNYETNVSYVAFESEGTLWNKIWIIIQSK